MVRPIIEVLQAADVALAEQNAEIAATAQRQLQSVVARSESGSADIDAAFSLDVRFRLVFVRCHFAGESGRAPLQILLDSALGAAHDVALFTVRRAGVDRDLNLRIPADESADPSPWTFRAGDEVRIRWTNPSPGSTTWGLEVGLAIAA